MAAGIGNTIFKNIKVGGTQVQNGYVGSNLFWSNALDYLCASYQSDSDNCSSFILNIKSGAKTTITGYPASDGKNLYVMIGQYIHKVNNNLTTTQLFSDRRVTHDGNVKVNDQYFFLSERGDNEIYYYDKTTFDYVGIINNCRIENLECSGTKCIYSGKKGTYIKEGNNLATQISSATYCKVGISKDGTQYTFYDNGKINKNGTDWFTPSGTYLEFLKIDNNGNVSYKAIDGSGTRNIYLNQTLLGHGFISEFVGDSLYFKNYGNLYKVNISSPLTIETIVSTNNYMNARSSQLTFNYFNF